MSTKNKSWAQAQECRGRTACPRVSTKTLLLNRTDSLSAVRARISPF